MPAPEPMANYTVAHTVTHRPEVNNFTVVIMTRGQAETTSETLSPNMVRVTVKQAPGSLTTTTLAYGNDNDNYNARGNDNVGDNNGSSRSSSARSSS